MGGRSLVIAVVGAAVVVVTVVVVVVGVVVGVVVVVWVVVDEGVVVVDVGVAVVVVDVGVVVVVVDVGVVVVVVVWGVVKIVVVVLFYFIPRDKKTYVKCKSYTFKLSLETKLFSYYRGTFVSFLFFSLFFSETKNDFHGKRLI